MWGGCDSNRSSWGCRLVLTGTISGFRRGRRACRNGSVLPLHVGWRGLMIDQVRDNRERVEMETQAPNGGDAGPTVPSLDVVNLARLKTQAS